jgi:hypothetical protein
MFVIGNVRARRTSFGFSMRRKAVSCSWEAEPAGLVPSLILPIRGEPPIHLFRPTLQCAVEDAAVALCSDGDHSSTDFRSDCHV